ncbi:hypothetical protein NPIL_272141 [Nephila pilipes]|uniref:Uncharacterized protein n=1 Tax=Nephila pilipes TaxID=299642 RepID=A0A8X6P414_NEPPI|nr:hypothetical protein NPIL_272141 [Nephila pilipes]
MGLKDYDESWSTKVTEIKHADRSPYKTFYFDILPQEDPSPKQLLERCSLSPPFPLNETVNFQNNKTDGKSSVGLNRSYYILLETNSLGGIHNNLWVCDCTPPPLLSPANFYHKELRLLREDLIRRPPPLSALCDFCTPSSLERTILGKILNSDYLQAHIPYNLRTRYRTLQEKSFDVSLLEESYF